MDISVLGVDVAKRVFQLHGADKNGKPVLRKKVSRLQLLDEIARLSPCVIGMEACGGANYWAREFAKFGHQVRVVSARFVKPYVKSNKTDAADAEAIAEAVSRPTMRFVSPKSIAQQDLQSLHRVRERLVRNRTALSNEIRGLLLEYGIVLPKGLEHLRKRMLLLLWEEQEKLSELGMEFFQELREDLRKVDERIGNLEKQIARVSQENPAYERLRDIPGVGPLTASAVIGAVNNPTNFKSGREFSAWLGLVPKQYSTGGKVSLRGISKRGNCYIRKLLIHGARATMRHTAKKADIRSQWVEELRKRKGDNKTAVALANKNARVMWALLARGENYSPALMRA